MGKLKDKPIEIKLMGKTHHLLFTVNAIYEVQEQLKIKMFDILKELQLEKPDICKIVFCITTILINDSITRSKAKKKELLMTEIVEKLSIDDFFVCLNGIIQTIKESYPIPDDDECDYVEETRKTEEPDMIVRMFTIGHLLGYKDDEIWTMTPKKLIAMHSDLKAYNTGDKPRLTIDDIT